MRNTLKNLVLSTVPPVQKLQQDRDSLRVRLAHLEADLRETKKELAASSAALSARASFVPPHHMPFDFDTDGMKLWDKNLKSLHDPRFVEAYEHVAEEGAHIEFRAYVCCWAATQAAKLPGDFVECGVNTGWLSLTICKFLDFNAIVKSFFLFDTYNGIPEEQVHERERDRAALHRYNDCYEVTKAKFSPYRNVKLVRGRVPDTLPGAGIDKVSYLSIDMNIAKPERDAIEFFWPKLVSGGIVVLDDYAFGGYDAQHEAMDEFAASVGACILTLPTGQGLIVKR